MIGAVVTIGHRATMTTLMMTGTVTTTTTAVIQARREPGIPKM
jgi:hypothetical protein